VNIGALRDKVTVQQRVPVADGQGGRTVTWSTFTRVSANVRALSATERLQAAAVTAGVAYEVTLRYRGDLSVTMRLLWTPFDSAIAKTLQILGLRPLDSARDFIVLDCAEVAA
jgi:SPP1 family predicted phage head-tail adaptor